MRKKTYRTFVRYLIVQSPLQQGLKRIFLKIKYIPIRLIVQSPLQQGLKQNILYEKNLNYSPYRTKSITTRIETWLRSDGFSTINNLIVQSPLQQGLKLYLNCPNDRIVPTYRTKSITTRIETSLPTHVLITSQFPYRTKSITTRIETKYKTKKIKYKFFLSYKVHYNKD